mmetsp:Transcript_30080/g.99084  ORF Transcript_30080/g.99084 Transcript_30080/m.99084 type:complete len:244 (-) Transcript_30080:92-823(-)
MGAGGFGVRARHRHRRGSQEPLDLAQPRLHLRGARRGRRRSLRGGDFSRRWRRVEARRGRGRGRRRGGQLGGGAAHRRDEGVRAVRDRHADQPRVPARAADPQHAQDVCARERRRPRLRLLRAGAAALPDAHGRGGQARALGGPVPHRRPALSCCKREHRGGRLAVAASPRTFDGPGSAWRSEGPGNAVSMVRPAGPGNCRTAHRRVPVIVLRRLPPLGPLPRVFQSPTERLRVPPGPRGFVR